jgi:hypothetical protein
MGLFSAWCMQRPWAECVRSDVLALDGRDASQLRRWDEDKNRRDAGTTEYVGEYTPGKQ